MGCLPNGQRIAIATTVISLSPITIGPESLSNMGKISTISATSQSTLVSDSSKESFVAKLRKSSWLNVVDYLNYSDLKEVGKINKTFNYCARHDTVLIKFFKNRKGSVFSAFSNKTPPVYVNSPYKKAILTSQSFAQLNEEQSNYFSEDSIVSFPN